MTRTILPLTDATYLQYIFCFQDNQFVILLNTLNPHSLKMSKSLTPPLEQQVNQIQTIVMIVIYQQYTKCTTVQYVKSTVIYLKILYEKIYLEKSKKGLEVYSVLAVQEVLRLIRQGSGLEVVLEGATSGRYAPNENAVCTLLTKPTSDNQIPAQGVDFS